MNHLNAVHQCRKSIDNGLRSAGIEGFDEFLEGGEVLDVILSLIEGFGDGDIDSLPPPQHIKHRLPGLIMKFTNPRYCMQNPEYGLALPGFETFGNRGDPSHSSPPKFEFCARAWGVFAAATSYW